MTLNFIKKSALECGFDLCGVAKCRNLYEHKYHLHNYISHKYHANLEYMERNLEKRLDPALLMESAQSVIVCGVSYNNLAWRLQKENKFKVASYAFAKDYHVTIKSMLNELLSILKTQCPTINARAFVDTAPILEKAWAVEAGLGWIGKNSLLITKEFGSLLNLGELIIDTTLDKYSEPFSQNHCGECQKCIDNCPNSAIISPRTIDTRRCISRITVEKRSDSPSPELPTHNWLFGCDDCQSPCPFNQKAKLYSNQQFAPIIDPKSLSTEFTDTLSEDDFKKLFKESPINHKRNKSIKINP